ncbi:MAG: stage III sporulation protein AG [Lachnospiraceae bacterium]
MAIRKETILVLFLVGALLLIIVWPTGSKGEQTAPGSKASRDTKLQTEQEEESLWDYKRRVEEELETILEKMEGVGQTNVMINVGDSGKTVVEKDVAVSEHSEGEKDTKTLVDSDRSEETVFTENEDGEQPFVVNTLSPQIQGVLVVAEGGDDPEVRAKVLEAVMALFQLESHKISIVKGN